jgi:AraC family transcriptional regulator of adaptative response / DNA-3-methyladenine glycosylase II
VPFAEPFSFRSVLGYLAPRAIPGVEVVSGGKYMRVISSCGFPGVIEVSQPGDEPNLEVVAHLPTFDNLIDDVARCHRLFGLDMDLTEARQSLSQDPQMARLMAADPGLTVPGAWDRFETAVRVIVGQQVSVKAASAIAGRIAGEFGTPVPGLEAFDLDRLFPSADRLAGVDLASLGLTPARARTVQSFAQAVASGAIDLYRYESLERLEELPGIGPWTANMIAMRVFGHLDAFAEGDIGLQRAVSRLLAPDGRGAKAAGEAAEAWRPWRALAAMYLWTSGGPPARGEQAAS